MLLSQQRLFRPAVRGTGGQADQAVRVGSFGLSRWELVAPSWVCGKGTPRVKDASGSH